MLPITFAYTLVLASMYLLKPARNALFLGRFGAEELPNALVLAALVGGVAATLYARCAQPVRIQRSIAFVFPSLAGMAFAFWIALPLVPGGALVYPFYVWVNLFGILATSLVWLLANAVFDAREARRTFGYIAAGGIGGAVLGGLLTRAVAPVIGTGHLLLVASALIAAAGALLRLPRPLEQTAVPSRRNLPPTDSALTAMVTTPLLRWLLPLVLLTGVVSALVDIQFNYAVDEHFAGIDAKAAFFGQFFAILSALAFIFQLLVAPRVLRFAGVGAALLVLPLLLASGSAFLLVLPGLYLSLLPKAADLGLRHSLHKSATEILVLPIPVALKERVKLVLDSVADNVGTGIGALLVLGLEAFALGSQRSIALLVVVISIGWAFVAWRVRVVYVDAFREAISRRELDPTLFRVELSDGAAIHTLVAALASEHDRHKEYALGSLATIQNPAIVAPARRLLTDPSPDIRRLAIAALAAQPDSSSLGAVRPLLLDSCPRVRVAAVHYVCTRDGQDPIPQLAEFLVDDDERVRLAAIGALAEHWPEAAPELLDERFVQRVLSLEGPLGVFARSELARLLGAGGWRGLDAHRERLIADESPEVVLATIEAAGRARTPDLIPWLMDRLASRRWRAPARAALARFGDEIVLRARRAWLAADTPPRVRTALPRLLAEVPTQRAIDTLLDLLPQATPLDRLSLLKALNRLRLRRPAWVPSRKHLLLILDMEVEHHTRLVELYRAGGGPTPTPHGRLLWRALDEQITATVARAFRVLGLLGDPKDAYDAYLAVASGNRVARANALEFLDNALDRELSRRLVGMLEADPRLGSVAGTPSEAWLARAVRETTGWLKACAVFAGGKSKSPEVLAAVAAAATDDNPAVREAVAHSRSR